jgi:hypothetical protein
LLAFRESLIRLGAVCCFVDRVDTTDMATGRRHAIHIRFTCLCSSSVGRAKQSVPAIDGRRGHALRALPALRDSAGDARSRYPPAV